MMFYFYFLNDIKVKMIELECKQIIKISKRKKITIQHNKNKSIDFRYKKNLIQSMNFYFIRASAIRDRVKNVKIDEARKKMIIEIEIDRLIVRRIINIFRKNVLVYETMLRIS